MATDAPEVPEQLYSAREPVFPRRVRGKFRALKWMIMAVALGIYYLTPWIRWDRGPNLPDQAVLVDLERAVEAGETAPTAAAQILLERFTNK